MIIIGYLILAVIVMGFSIQLSNYVDIIDKRTSLSGAFIGGVILAAISAGTLHQYLRHCPARSAGTGHRQYPRQ